MGRFIFVSFGLLVVFLSLSGTAADCPPDWSSYEGHCYRVFKQLMIWADAERFCSKQAKGGHLVSIESQEEADFVVKVVSANIQRRNLDVWIGLRAHNKGQQCSSNWSDGSCVCYENLVGQNVKKCFALKGQQEFLQWYNIDCQAKNVFICKSPPP